MNEEIAGICHRQKLAEEDREKRELKRKETNNRFNLVRPLSSFLQLFLGKRRSLEHQARMTPTALRADRLTG